MLVVTADQKGSRVGEDLVPKILAELQVVSALRPFQRTAGDEIQGVFSDPAGVVAAARLLFEDGNWYVGIGGGSVEYPLPEDARSGRGEAFIHARRAVEMAKRIYPPLSVQATRDHRDANAALGLLAGVWTKRTPPGWEAVRTLMRMGGTQSVAAKSLGISEQAFSQRLRTALWQVEEQSIAMIERSLAAASGELR